VKVFPAFFCSATGRNEPMSAEQIFKRLSDAVVGGGPISPGFAKRIGVDGYAVNAAEAVKVARELVGLQGTA
jgi:methanogenic corrinoid protein MtbC1